MSIEQPITSTDNFFLGEDKTITFDVTTAAGVSPQTMPGWALTWELKASAGGTVHITKTASLSSKFGTNDRATGTITDGNTEAIAAGAYFHVLRRTDAGSEQILAFGDVTLRESGLG